MTDRKDPALVIWGPKEQGVYEVAVLKSLRAYGRAIIATGPRHASEALYLVQALAVRGCTVTKCELNPAEREAPGSKTAPAHTYQTMDLRIYLSWS